MNSVTFIALPLALLFFLSACATSMFNIKSTPPQAEVFLMDQNTEKKTAVGKTPISLPTKEFNELVKSSNPSGQFFTLVIEKDGYLPQTFQLPFSKSTTLVTSLEVKLKEGKKQNEIRLAREILDHLFLSQKFAQNSEFERAQIEIDKVLAQVPNFPRALSMKGSIYFAQKKYPESIKYYEEAIKNDPNLEDAIKMLSRAKMAMGIAPKANPVQNKLPLAPKSKASGGRR